MNLQGWWGVENKFGKMLTDGYCFRDLADAIDWAKDDLLNKLAEYTLAGFSKAAFVEYSDRAFGMEVDGVCRAARYVVSEVA